MNPRSAARLVLPILAAAVLACGWVPLRSDADTGLDLAALERDVDGRINDYRESTGRAPFAWEDSVAKIAREHSREMAKGKTPFGHEGLQKRSETIQKKMVIAGMAENVSRHQRDSGFAEAAVTRWLASPAHLKNINGDYDLAGVGAALSKNGTVYLTQIFVKRRVPASP